MNSYFTDYCFATFRFIRRIVARQAARQTFRRTRITERDERITEEAMEDN